MAIETCGMNNTRFLLGPLLEPELAALLTEAKIAHSRYEEFYAREGQTPPAHSWEEWYARFIFDRIEREGL